MGEAKMRLPEPAEADTPEVGPMWLPLSMVNQYWFCRRRFYLMMQGEMAENAPLLAGRVVHRRVHTAGMEAKESGWRFRRVLVWSEALRLIGYVDVVEQQGQGVVPVEHKRGRSGPWWNDRLQVAAQALCLEERLRRPVSVGFLYYHGSARRVLVPVDEALRRQVVETVAAMRAVLRQTTPPPPLPQDRRCWGCSLRPICLPRETALLIAAGERRRSRSKGLDPFAGVAF